MPCDDRGAAPPLDPSGDGFNYPRWVLELARVSSTVRHARKAVEAMCNEYLPLLQERDRYKAAMAAFREEADLLAEHLPGDHPALDQYEAFCAAFDEEQQGGEGR